MYSARVPSTDLLYNRLNTFLAHKVPHKVVISSRNDYRDPNFLKVTLDYGAYTIDLKDEGVQCGVQHLAPTEVEEAALVVTSDSYEMNMKLIDLAIRSFVKTKDERVVKVFSWESGWHQRQAVWVPDHKVTESQQCVLEHVETFYAAKPNKEESCSLPYQRCLMLSGGIASGKHWVARAAALRNDKAIAFIPITEATYTSIGPALACAPLNSVIVMDGLAQFYRHLPVGERCVFLRHLETAFNTAVCDPRGLLILLLCPPSIPPELERFLLMPHRFQKKLELTLSTMDQLQALLAQKMPTLSSEEAKALAKKAAGVQLPIHVLQWFFAESLKDATTNGQSAVTLVEELIHNVRDERKHIDGAVSGQVHRESMYC